MILSFTDHYALVQIVTKGRAKSHQRLLRLCLDIQGFTFRVTHRNGIDHIDADVVSQFLMTNEQPYVRTAI